MKEKSTKSPSRFWRLCRVCFRRIRITVWLLLLALVSIMLYLNQVGLPNFAKQPLLKKLRARGLDLQFSRLRIRWFEGIVADNVRFGRAGDPETPQLTLKEVKVSLDYQALTRLKFQIDGLGLRNGRLVWPVVQGPGPARQLIVDNIRTQLRLLPGDQWALDHFTANFAGAKIQVSGLVTNASAFRDWKVFTSKQPAKPGTLQQRLRQLTDTLERIHFSAPPELALDIRGDARDVQSFNLRLALMAPGADTPWGTLSQGRFLARLLPAGTNELSRADVSLEAAGARYQQPGMVAWAAITNLILRVHLATAAQTNLVNGELVLLAANVQTEWGTATNASINAQWLHALTNPVPVSAQGRLRCEAAQTHLAGGAQVGTLELTGRLSPSQRLPTHDPAWAWWTNLEPYSLEWECCLTDLLSPRLRATTIAAAGDWRPPRLTITNLEADLYQARLQARAVLDVASRSLDGKLASNVDPHLLSPLLTDGARRWLAQYSWNQAPLVSGNIALRLPAWTNQHPDWRAELQPALRLSGQFQIDHGAAFQGIPVNSASGHFDYSNMVWLLPDLTVTRPEGNLVAFHRSDDRTKDFYWNLSSSLDPTILRPFLEPRQQRDFDLITFTQPPRLAAEIWGRWHDQDRVGFNADVALTNVAIRGESLSAFHATLLYSNRFLLLTNAQAQRGLERMGAESLGIDFPTRKIYLANGFSTADPQAIARAIGPKVAQAIEPYRFARPPTARVHGIIPTRDDADADLHFDIDGGPFEWLKFHAGHIAGHVHWKGQRLSLEDVRSEFYGGSAAGAASFDFSPAHRTDYQFNLTATNAFLQKLMADVSPHTNNLEGRLSGSLIVNQANSTDWRSWQGGGNVDLRDGLIWEIPIFGIFSPVLNSISPGLGNSRASAATGTFSIKNGVIQTDDLEIRSPAMRLKYNGSVNLQGQVNARVEAELLRDVWLLGPLVSTVFWPVTKLFEYKVAGSLAQPKTDQVYFMGKLILMPFHPFRALKDLLPEETAPSTNAPPFKLGPSNPIPSTNAPAAKPAPLNPPMATNTLPANIPIPTPITTNASPQSIK